MTTERKKIPPIREQEKKTVHCSMSGTLSFDDVMVLANHDPKKLTKVIEKVLVNESKEEQNESKEKTIKLDLSAEEFVKLFRRVRSLGLKDKIRKVFDIYIKKKCEKHSGSDKDFYFLVDSVVIDNCNPFYININLNVFFETVLLNWQRAPLSYKTLNYAFEVLFYGRAIDRCKMMESLEKQYGNFRIFTSQNIKGFFKDACFGNEFVGRTPEVRESKRRSFLLEIFERLVDCVEKVYLQVGDSDCCDQFATDAINQISLVKKYADMLYIIGTIDKDSRRKKLDTLDAKRQAILANQKKWKQKATKGGGFSN